MQPKIICTLCRDTGRVEDLMPIQLRHATQMVFLAPVHFACERCRAERAKKWKKASWSSTRLHGVDGTVYAQQLSTHVLTLKQPYAWLVVNGLKDCENRGWASKFIGRVLIHASQQPADDYYGLAMRILDTFGVECPKVEDLDLGKIVGVARFDQQVGRHGAKGLGWFTGPRAWPVDWARPFPEPIEARGMPGFWRVSDQLPIKL